MKKKKIAIIGTPNLPIPAVRGGAIETLVTALLNENERKSEFSFTVFTIDDSLLDAYQKQYASSTIVRIPKTSFFEHIWEWFYKVLRKLLRYSILPRNAFMCKVNAILSRNQFDLILFESTQNEVMQLSNNNGAKVAYHVHSDFLSDNVPGITRIKSVCDYYIGVSNYIVNSLCQMKGVDQSTAFPLMNAVSVSEIQKKASAVNRSDVRKKIGLKAEDVVLLYCSRLSPEKGVLELVKAIQTVKNCKLIVVGGDNFSSSKQTTYVKEVFKEASFTNNRVIFTGYVEHSNIWDFFAASDIAIVPSTCNEAASLALLEFRSAGLSTIISNKGGMPEYTDETKSLFVEVDDSFVYNLSAKIDILVNNCEKRKQMANNASCDLDIFDYPSYYQRFVDLVSTFI